MAVVFAGLHNVSLQDKHGDARARLLLEVARTMSRGEREREDSEDALHRRQDGG